MLKPHLTLYLITTTHQLSNTITKCMPLLISTVFSCTVRDQLFDKLQTGVELRKRKWKGNAVCNLCGKLETLDHILFSCITAKFLWTCFKESLGWDRIPIGWQDFLDTWIPLGRRVYHTKLFLLTMVAWTLWTTRNKRTIEGKFPRKPADLLFKTNFFLQKWKPLLRKGDQAKIEVLVAQVKGWTEPFFWKS